ncbi:Put3 protein [Martiniozyma asiatica (nom. inval.)]|nr:Put3 protein [Martiniozyma asiatica]
MNDPEEKKRRPIQACTSCRRRHVKCHSSGDDSSCTRCKELGLVCEYVEADRKVVISVKYLNKLQETISELKKENAGLRSKDIDTKTPINKKKDDIEEEPNVTNEPIIPPFLEKYGRLIHSRTGERVYIGSSSMTLFGLEINRLLAPMMNNTVETSERASTDDAKIEETILEKEGNAYRIMLGKTRSRPGMNVNFTLPSYSYAMLLVDSFISYNDGCFYFFNEGLVKENLRRIYNDENGGFKPDYGIDSLNASAENESTLETIWFCKLLLIFAVGEMYLGTANYLNGNKLTDKSKKKRKSKDKSMSDTESKYRETKLPGSGFFNQASDLFTGLFASGSIDNCTREGSIEVLLLYAFYLQVADCTTASYFYFGIALRASLLLGLHVDVGKDSLNRFELEHRRRLWWTVYMYERMLASKAGLPLSLTDEDISTELPSDFDMSQPAAGCESYIFPEAEFISNCVKITQINANILRKLYTRQPSTNILPIVHSLVVSLLKWKKSLPDEINCDYNQKELKITRLVVNVMTEYFQGINLAVRPLLFHFVIFNLNSSNPKSGTFLDLSKYSSIILTLLNASFQGSINTIRSLWALIPENMVAMFGYMDREYLFNAAATLILFNGTFGVYDATLEHLDHSLIMFTKMRNLGNHPATLRREQLLKLMKLLDFNNSMRELIQKHTDNINVPIPLPITDNKFGHKFTLNSNTIQNETTLQQFKSSNGFHDIANWSLNNISSTNQEDHTFSPSLLPVTSQIEDVPDFENLLSKGADEELWKQVTDQAAWLASGPTGDLEDLESFFHQG